MAVLPSDVVRGRQNPLHTGLASRLKRERKATGLSFDSIAEAAGLTDGSTVLHLERKPGHVPRLDTVERIAYALGLSPAFLAYGIEGEGPPVEALRSDGVGARLRASRLGRGLSVLALAQLAKTSHTAVGNIERGGTMPNVATIESLAKALNVSPGWLAYGVGPQSLLSRRRSAPSVQVS
jgi:transcriptional regulator with XRE-family HTH domain